MNTFWGLMGYLPVFIVAALLYGLGVALPRRLRKIARREGSGLARHAPTPDLEEEPLAPVQPRRRSLVSVSSVARRCRRASDERLQPVTGRNL